MTQFNYNRNKKKLGLLGLLVVVCGLLLVLLPSISHEIPNNRKVYGIQEYQIMGSYFNNSMTPIAIDGDATGPGAHNWAWAVSQPWCIGSGTKMDPYLIANLTIDGMGTNSCISIKDSNVFFIIENCTLHNSGIQLDRGGIYLDHCNNGKIINNTFFNTFAGVHLIQSNNNYVSENNCSVNGRYGIRLQSSSNNTFLENDCSSNDWVGIHVKTSNVDNIFIRNNCSASGLYGIESDSSSNNTYLENDCSSNGKHGINIFSSSDYNTISNNTCNLNGENGIRLSSADFNYISENNCSINTYHGIYLYFSKNNEILLNNCSANISHGILLSLNSNNNTVFRNIFNLNGKDGINIQENSNYNIISGNDCSLNGFNGIHLFVMESNVVSENIFISNERFGIYLYQVSDCEIFKNTIIDLKYSGIYLAESSNQNKIYSNHIEDAREYGVLVKDTNCANNLFYKNYFVDNSENVLNDGTANYWDNGIIGNYWDDYTGSDADLDGIGDDPYFVDGTGGGVDHYPIWFFYHLNPIYIDGDATGVGAHNWTWASYQPWCEGSGTWNDPYIIKDVIIDGQGVDNCIEIRDSNVPFIIYNTTLNNASSLDYQAAIYLDHVDNALILENDCSYNGHIGIILYENCNNNTIQGNVIYNNEDAGISIRETSENNYIYNNAILHCKGQFAIYLLHSDHNVIYKNFVFGCLTGVRVHATEHTTVTGNLLEHNQVGISLRHGHYSRVCHNDIIYSSNYGIRLDTTALCDIFDNYIYNTTYDGIRIIDNSRYNEIYSNEIKNASRYGVNVDDTNVHNNTFYENLFIDNDVNALDDGTDNYWDNGTIGNYWSDYWDTYLGVDLDDDGIGDTPYNIAGSAGKQDRYPIWDDGPGENHPPTWDQMPTDQTLGFGNPFLYDVNASDLSGIDHYWISDTTNFQIDDNGIISNQGTLMAGTYPLEIRAYDPYNNFCTETIEITILSENVPLQGIPGFDLSVLLLTTAILGFYFLLRIRRKKEL